MAQMDYGTMPQNIRKKEPFVDFEKRTTWFSAMTKALQKHSEFMRPELADGNFPDMEYAYPPIYDLPGEDGGGDPSEIPGNPMCAGCWITAQVFLGSLGNKNAQICFPYGGKICMTPEYDAMYSEWKRTGILPDELGGGRGEWPTLQASAAAWAAGSFEWRVIRGGPVPLEMVPKNERYYTGGYCIRPQGTGNYWPVDVKTTVQITFRDVYGSVCRDDETIFIDCCFDPLTETFAFDAASTADTITAGGSVSVYVTGGCAPYTWTKTSGTGYSFAVSTTTGLVNTLSCVAGTCNVDFSKICKFSITDKCGNTVTGSVRHVNTVYTTTGQAIGVVCPFPPVGYPPAYECCANVGGTSCPSTDLGVGNLMEYSTDLETRWTFGSNCFNPCEPPAAWTQTTGTYVEPPCGGPAACGSYFYGTEAYPDCTQYFGSICAYGGHSSDCYCALNSSDVQTLGCL